MLALHFSIYLLMWFFSLPLFNYCGFFFQHKPNIIKEIICQRKKVGEERKTKIFLYIYTVSLLNNFTAAFICKYFMLLNTYLHIIHSTTKNQEKKKKEKKNLIQEKEPRKKNKKTVGRKEKPAVLLKDLPTPPHAF